MSEGIQSVVFTILQNAISKRVHDIHFIPRAEGTRVGFREGKVLAYVQELSQQQYEQCLIYLKYVSGLNVSEKRLPQSGVWECNVLNQLFSLRLSFLPARFAESLTIRVHYAQNITSLHQLTFVSSTKRKLSSVVHESAGLILFCGATGQGKTTTMTILLQQLVRSKRRVITVEDPIEITIPGTSQMEIGEHTAFGYAEAIAAMLRHDPDVIVVGEIRDAHTAKMVVRAALTGHLVLTTLHASTVLGAILRLQEFGVSLIDVEECITLLSVQSMHRVAPTNRWSIVYDVCSYEESKALVHAVRCNGLPFERTNLSEVWKYYALTGEVPAIFQKTLTKT
ncbi:MAG: ATPase, T2SS/T4P/T4SS family [Bacilli bacterium]